MTKDGILIGLFNHLIYEQTIKTPKIFTFNKSFTSTLLIGFCQTQKKNCFLDFFPISISCESYIFDFSPPLVVLLISSCVHTIVE